MSAIPAHRPVLNPSVALATVQRAILDDKQADGPRIIGDCSVYVLAIRMPSIGVYDDTIAAVFRSGRDPVVCNGNTEPSRFGPSPLAHGKDEARIRPGVWPMIRGHHSDLPHCFRQASHEQAEALHLERYFRDQRVFGEFTVDRMAKDGTISKTETGKFSTNLHPGSHSSTSSAGCLTIPQPQYDELRDAVYAEMDMQRQAWLPVVIVLGPL